MKTFKSFAASLLVICAVAVVSPAQTILTMTTLSASIPVSTSPGSNVRYLSVASATGIAAPSSINGTIGAFGQAANTFLFIDRELLDVRAVSGTTIQVVRGAGGTKAAPHNTGALVFVIPSFQAIFFDEPPQGLCVRGQGNAALLPVIVASNPQPFYDCLGGQWTNGDIDQTQRSSYFRLPIPNTGATAYTSTGTSQVYVSGTLNCTELNLPYTKYMTGLGWLNGVTASTNNVLVALYDSTGNLLANSAVAGVLVSGASTYQTASFTTPYFAMGPAQYFGCTQANGTTATYRSITTGTQDQFLTKAYTGVFGTVPASITVPTTFTSIVGPYLEVF